ncbi:ribosome biogenesis GTPase Der [Candidatus Dependentiae bacterium]|nr:ribosome biogenesis GTPase Der [Candidatus Dependentiae bacterium]
MQNVVIVGRMNVGKSTLFNRIVKKPISISYDTEGVTRDFIERQVQLQHHTIRLLDTGGVSLVPSQDPIMEAVRLQSLRLIETAAVVLFVVDGTVGLVAQEREIGKLLHKLTKQVIVVVNKIDVGVAQQQQHEFVRLGFSHIVPVSGTHGTGIPLLLTTIEELLPANETAAEHSAERGYRVVLVGRPNVGKSSLMNLLLNKQRSIVSNVAGTTREAIEAPMMIEQQSLTLIDTAGVRRARSVEDELETLMVKSSLTAMRQADIVLMLVDASENKIADQELKLAFHAFDTLKKGMIILFNKTDLSDDYSKLMMQSSKDEYNFLLKKLETLGISCKSHKNVHKIMQLVATVWQRYNTKFDDLELSRTIKQALLARPLYRATQQLVVHRAYQLATGPIKIGLVVNLPQFFGPTQLGYIENVLRSHYDLKSVPISFIIEKRS